MNELLRLIEVVALIFSGLAFIGSALLSILPRNTGRAWVSNLLIATTTGTIAVVVGWDLFHHYN